VSRVGKGRGGDRYLEFFGRRLFRLRLKLIWLMLHLGVLGGGKDCSRWFHVKVFISAAILGRNGHHFGPAHFRNLGRLLQRKALLQ
jgi:hypothetical protein